MTQTAAATIRTLHGANAALASENFPLCRAVGRVLSHAVENADDTFAGQENVCEEVWARVAIGSLEVLLSHDAPPEVREWFLAQGFTF